MRGPWRWGVCAALAAALVAVPFVLRYAPVPVADAAPAVLLARMQASWSKPYTGYAESTGTLALPASDQLDAHATLVSGRTQVRVWWQSATDWRADTITPAGETGVRTNRAGSLTWSYEDNRVVLAAPDAENPVRLPRDTDTLPPLLAARMLGDATATEVTSLPPRRVAGRPAEGLELRPGDPLSSIGRVDVWADAASGIPVLVEVFGRTSDLAAMSSTFLDFSDAAPAAADLAFAVPPRARVRSTPRSDLVRDIARSGGPRPPSTLLGFARSSPGAGVATIGEYGRGVTQLAVGALPDRLAGSLRDQLRLATGARELPAGLVVAVGPVSLLLTTSRAGTAWLVAGTVTADGLAQAAAELETVGS